MTDVQGWRRRLGIVACAAIGVAAPVVAFAFASDPSIVRTTTEPSTERPQRAAAPVEAAPQSSRVRSATVVTADDASDEATGDSTGDTERTESVPKPEPTPELTPELTDAATSCGPAAVTDPPEVELPAEFGTVRDWARHPIDGRWYAVSDLGSVVRWDPDERRYGSGYPNAVVPKGDYRDVVFDAAGDLYAIDADRLRRAYQLDLRESTADAPIDLSGLDWSRPLDVDGVADCAPAYDFGDAAGGYPTVTESNGASHRSDPKLTLGPTSTAEPIAVLSDTEHAGDQGDDALDTVEPIEPYATRYSVDVPYVNRLGSPVTLAGWLDADLDGRFTDDERHVVSLEPGDPTPELSWPVPEIRPDGTSQLRLRLYEGQVDDPDPIGAVDALGEVEDYPVQMVSAPVADLYVETLGATTTAGRSGTLPLVVGNTGPSNAELDVMVRVAPPAHVSFGEPPSNCDANLDGTVDCRLPAGRLPAGGDPLALQLPFTVDSAAPELTELEGGGVEVDTTRDPSPENNQAGLRIQAGTAESELSLDVDPADDPVPPGKSAMTTVRVANAGPSDTAESTRLEVTAPPGSSPGSGLPDGCVPSGVDTVSCEVRAGLAANTSRTYDIPIRPDSDRQDTTKLTGGHVGLDGVTGRATFGVRTAKPVADVSITTSSTNQHRLAPGRTFRYHVRVTNHGPSDARDVEYTERIPAALAFESPDVPGCELTAHELSCSGVDLPSGETIDHSLLVRLSPVYAGDGSDLIDDADVYASTPDPVQANNTRNANVPRIGVGPRRIDLRPSATPPANGITPGTVDTMTLTAENVGPSSTAGRGRAELALPPGMSVPAGGLSSDCEVGGSGSVVRCAVAAGLRPGTKQQWALRIEASPDVPRGGRYAGGVARAADPADPHGGNDSAEFAVRATRPLVDLVMAKRPESDRPVRPGETFGYELTVTNSGPSNATNVAIRDQLPPPLAFADSKQGCRPASGDAVVCPAIDELRAGASRTFVVDVQLDKGYRGDGREIANRAVVSSDVDDLDESNNSSEFSTSGMPGGVVTQPTADLSVLLESSADGRAITPGETVEYRLVAENGGPHPAVHTRLSGFLPAPLAIVSSPDGCVASGQRLDCSAIDSIDVGERVERRVAVRLDPRYAGDGSDLAVWATVRSYSTDADPTNNSISRYR